MCPVYGEVATLIQDRSAWRHHERLAAITAANRGHHLRVIDIGHMLALSAAEGLLDGSLDAREAAAVLRSQAAILATAA